MTTFSRILILIIISVLLIACGSKTKNETAVTEKTEIPKTDLHSAVFNNNLDLIRQHIESGSDVNVLEPSRESTPLISAAFLGRTEAAQLLIDAGADLDYQNVEGSTALHTAIVFDKTEVAQMLIGSGCNLDIKNNSGSTPIHTAAFFCRKDVLRQLIENGADPDIPNNDGYTALQVTEIPFTDLKMVYQGIETALKPLGFQLDLEFIEKTRPEIAAMLSKK
jgi:ankyrin repeat protein